MKTHFCNTCREDKSIDQFHTVYSHKGIPRLKRQCKSCILIGVKRKKESWSKEDWDKYKARKYRNRQNYKITNPKELMIRRAKKRAKQHNLEFNIDISDINIPKLCPILKTPLILNNSGKLAQNAPSLDRVDPNKGYVKGNVSVISFRINTLKSNLTLAQLRRLYKYVKNHNHDI